MFILNCSLVLSKYVKYSYFWSTGRITFFVVSSCAHSNNQVKGNVFCPENLAVFSIIFQWLLERCIIKINMFRRLFLFFLFICRLMIFYIIFVYNMSYCTLKDCLCFVTAFSESGIISVSFWVLQLRHPIYSIVLLNLISVR